MSLPAIPSIADLSAEMESLVLQRLLEAAQDNDITLTLSPADLALARSNVRALAFVQAVGTHGVYRYVRDFLSRQCIPTTSQGVFLDEWLTAYGLPRKQASPATGTTNGSGVAAAILPAATALKKSDGTVYQTIGDATVNAAGGLSVQVLSVALGQAANAAAGEILTLVSPVDGIDSSFTIDTDGLGGGADRETDAAATLRLAQRLANPPLAGSPGDYERWCLSVPGITRAWCKRATPTNGQVTVLVMADGNVNGLPTAANIDAVMAYLWDDRAPAADEIFVVAPTLKPLNPTIKLTPDTAVGRAAVEAELRDLYWREAYPGYAMPKTHLVEAASLASGEVTHQFVSPIVVADGTAITATAYELPTLGAITWQA